MAAPDAVKKFFTSVIVNNHGDANETILNNDKQKYWERVKTYSILSWSAKPNCLSPIICACHGWENTRPNLLRCVSCKKILSATLPNAWEEFYEKSLKKLVEMVSYYHEDFCIWKSNATPDYIYGLPHTLNDDAYCIEYFDMAVTSLSLMYHLPKLNIKFIDYMGTSISELKYIYARLHEGVDKSNVNRIKFGIREMTLCALAICGWTKRDNYQEILECKYCQRHAGLWNYASLERGKDISKEPHQIDSAVSVIKYGTANGDPNGFNGLPVKRSCEHENGVDPSKSCGKKLKIAHVAPMPHEGYSLRSGANTSARAETVNLEPKALEPVHNGDHSSVEIITLEMEGGKGSSEVQIVEQGQEGATDAANFSTNINECLLVIPPVGFGDGTHVVDGLINCTNGTTEISSLGAKDNSTGNHDLPLISIAEPSSNRISEGDDDRNEIDVVSEPNLSMPESLTKPVENLDDVCVVILNHLVDEVTKDALTNKISNDTLFVKQPNLNTDELTNNCRGALNKDQIDEGPQTDSAIKCPKNLNVKKRDRLHITTSDIPEELNALFKEEDSTQNFDPLSQHRSWCPWVTKQEGNFSSFEARHSTGIQAFYYNLKFLAHRTT